MEDCLFCKIIKGEIPCYKIYEDKNTFVFLDVNPWSRGHCLVVPKKHFRNILEIDKKTLADVVLVVQKISSLAKEKLGAVGMNILQNNNRMAGQEVDHIHFHIIPRYADGSLKISHLTNYKGDDLETVIKLLTNNN